MMQIEHLALDAADWKIGVVVGPPGSGKTSIGRAIWPDVGIYDGDTGWPQDAPIVDAIAPAGNFDDVTGALSAVGLGSVPAWLPPLWRPLVLCRCLTPLPRVRLRPSRLLLTRALCRFRRRPPLRHRWRPRPLRSPPCVK